MARSIRIPRRLAEMCAGDPQRTAWLRELPQVVAELEECWSLEVGEAFDHGEGSCAWVAPVRRVDGSSAVLKLGMPHMQGEHEIEGLCFWRGDPTVFLYEADANLGAMLIERCDPGTPLRSLPEPEQDVVLASLLRRLWRTPKPPHPFRPLAEMTARWIDTSLAQRSRWLDPGLVGEGLELLRALPQSASDDVLLATDLHAGNVLRARREPWLVIDPKPFVGDPAYDATQHLFKCRERLHADPLGLIRRFAGLLGVDQERVRLWTFARAVVESVDDTREAESWSSLASTLAP